MSYKQVSIKKAGNGAGCAMPKNPTVILVDVEDVTAEPTRENGVTKVVGELTLGVSAKATGVYATPTSIEAGYEMAGELDAKGFKQKVAFEHPGDSEEINNFIEHAANRGYIILVTGCDGAKGKTKIYGSKCNPMFINVEQTDNKEALKAKLSFAQEQTSQFVPGFYEGALPALAEDAAPASEAL